MRDANWIQGAWSSSESGDSFEANLRDACDGTRDWWPRSGPGDLELALAGLAAGARTWQSTRPAERKRVLRNVLDDWQNDCADLDHLTACLGFSEGELDEHLEHALLAGDASLAAQRAKDSPRDSRPHLLRVPAAESLAGFVRSAFPALLSGRPLLVLSDADLPQLAYGFVRQLLRDERLASCVALLHEDRSTCLTDAIENASVVHAYAPGLALAKLTDSASVSIDRTAPRNSSFAVLRDDDPAAAATWVYEHAVGPARTFSGQLAGQIGRVFCHERQFSAFTEDLLARIQLGNREPACPIFTSGLGEHCARVRRLGLDEGATLIAGGATDSRGYREAAKKGILAASVFTNVEPAMGLARAFRPAPILALVRVESDAEACALLKPTSGS